MATRRATASSSSLPRSHVGAQRYVGRGAQPIPNTDTSLHALSTSTSRFARHGTTAAVEANEALDKLRLRVLRRKYAPRHLVPRGDAARPAKARGT